MDIADPAVAYAALRASTAKMFDYDLADLSLTQGLQIDLVSLLRLEVDTMQGRVLAGETVDLQRLVAAHGLLSRMLPAQALVAPAAAADQGDPFAGAREELSRFLAGRAEALAQRAARLEAADAERMAVIYANEEMAAIAAAAPSAPSPASGVCGTVTQTTPPQSDNVVPIDAELQRLRSRTVPPKSPEREAECAANAKAFRDSFGGGPLIAPAWSPPDERRR